MRIERLEVVRVGGALSGVAANRRTTWRERAGLRLAVFDERGRVGLGEASPLPGYSPETIDDAEAALAIDVATLNAALAVLRGDGGLEEERDVVVREGGRVIGAAAARLVGPVPSARFALETALLDLVGQRAGVPIHAMLGAPSPAAVPVSALVVSRSPDGAADEARRAVARGMRTLKLKLGLGSLDDERALLRAVRAAVPADVALRLDANGQAALPPRELLDAVAPFAIELVEEPGPIDAVEALDARRASLPVSASVRASVAASIPVAIALDESLQGEGGASRLARLAGRGLVRAAVLKPMALGGFAVCVELAAIARAAGASVVVTHLFDGPIAHAAATHLALAIETPGVAAGLDTHAGLDAWPAVRARRGAAAAEGLDPARTLPWLRDGFVVSPSAPGLFDDDVRRALLGGDA